MPKLARPRHAELLRSSPRELASLAITGGESDEVALVERIRAGDESAFDVLVRRLYPALCRVAVHVTRSFESAEDVVVEVLVGFWNHRAEVRGAASARSYLYRAVRNRALSVVRNDRHREHAGLEMADAVADDRTDVDARFAASDIEQALEQAVAELPDRCRAVYILSREDELSYAEIADVLGISVRTVDAHLCKALARIREALGPLLG